MPPVQHSSEANLFDASAGLVRADTVTSAIESVVSIAEATLEAPVCVVWDDNGKAPTPVRTSDGAAALFSGRRRSPPGPPTEDATTLDGDGPTETEHPERRQTLFSSSLFLRVREQYLLSLHTTEPDRFDERDKKTLEGIGSNLEAALDRIDEDQPAPHQQQTEQGLDVLKRVYEVTADSTLTFDEKLEALLAAGREYLGLPSGFLTRVATEETDGPVVQTIVAAQTPHELLQPGEQCPLPQTYCKRTVDDSILTTITHASETGWVGDPAYERFGLETYIAGPIDVGGDTYGTLCFSSTEPRGTEFTATERAFVSLLGRWVGCEISQRDSRNGINQQRQRLARTLSKINTGVAEWNLPTEAMTRTQTLKALAGTDAESVEEFREAIHDYIGNRTAQRERSRRLNAIFNGTFQFIGLLETDGTVVEVNESALEFGGFERENVVGEQFYDVAWWTHSETVNTQIRDALERAAGGEFVRYETEVYGRQGIATIDFSANPVTDEDGEVTMIIVEGRDITAQRQRRQHMDVMQRVMRHNMRNDLTKVRSWTQLMSEEPDAETRAEQFDRITSVLDKWGTITEKLKQIRQAIRSDKTLQAAVDPQSLVDRTVSSARRDHPEASIETTLSDVGTARVSTFLRTVLRELIDNSVTATEQADVHVEVSLSLPEDDWVEFAVSDRGPGMPRAEAEVLETGEETQLTHGSSLGLWMVRMLVKHVGGTVSVDLSGPGTTVRFQVPTKHSAGGSGTGLSG